MNIVGFAVLYVTLSILDLLTTFIGLQKGHVEGNVFAAWFFEQWGYAGLGFYKTITVAAIVNLAASYWHKSWVRWFAYGGTAALLLVVIGNIITISQ